MGLQTITNSTVPLSLDEAKQYLRIDGTQDDPMLSLLIASAVEWVQDQTGTQVVPATLQLTLDAFPSSREIKLPRPPLTTVSSVSYFDPQGQYQTLSSDTYTVDAASKPGRIVLLPGHPWPVTDGRAAAVTVEFNAGPSDGQPLSPSLKQAIRFMVGHWFENREAATDRRIEEVPLSVLSILNKHWFPEVA
jgi:uncharacterized phiE125 gp8 family phage protein